MAYDLNWTDNVTDIVDYVNQTNAMTGHGDPGKAILIPLLLLALAFVLVIMYIKRGIVPALIGSSFVVTIVAAFFWVLGFIKLNILIYPILVLIGMVVYGLYTMNS